MASDQTALWMRRFSTLVPIGLVLLVFAVAIPAILHARDAARRLQSKNNLKQFGLALQNYDDTHMAFPPGGTFDAAGNAHHGWLTFLYPYLYASPWYNFVNFDVPWDDPLNIAVFKLGENFGETLHNPSIRETKSADGFTLAALRRQSKAYAPQ